MKKQGSILLISLWIVSLTVGCQLNGSNTTVTAMLATQVIGYAVNDANGSAIGVVQGLVLEPESGEVTYAVVQLSQSPSNGKATAAKMDDLVAIPWHELQVKADSRTLVFKADKVIVQGAPRLAELPDTLVEGWDDDIHRYWSPLPDR